MMTIIIIFKSVSKGSASLGRREKRTEGSTGCEGERAGKAEVAKILRKPLPSPAVSPVAELPAEEGTGLTDPLLPGPSLCSHSVPCPSCLRWSKLPCWSVLSVFLTVPDSLPLLQYKLTEAGPTLSIISCTGLITCCARSVCRI